MPGRSANKPASVASAQKAAIRAAKKDLAQRNDITSQKGAAGAASSSSSAHAHLDAHGSSTSSPLGLRSGTISTGMFEEGETNGTPRELEAALRTEQTRADLAEAALEQLKQQMLLQHSATTIGEMGGSGSPSSSSSNIVAQLGELRERLTAAEAARDAALSDASDARLRQVATTERLEQQLAAALQRAETSETSASGAAADLTAAERQIDAARAAHRSEIAELRMRHAREVSDLVSALSRKASASSPQVEAGGDAAAIGGESSAAIGGSGGSGIVTPRPLRPSHLSSSSHAGSNVPSSSHDRTSKQEAYAQSAGGAATATTAAASPGAANLGLNVASPLAAHVAAEVARAADAAAAAEIALASREIANLGRHHIEAVHALAERLERLALSVSTSVSKHRGRLRDVYSYWRGVAFVHETPSNIEGGAYSSPSLAEAGGKTPSMKERRKPKSARKESARAARSARLGGAAASSPSFDGRLAAEEMAVSGEGSEIDADIEPSEHMIALTDEALDEALSLERQVQGAVHELDIAREQLYAQLYSKASLLGQHYLSNYPMRIAPPALLQPPQDTRKITHELGVQCELQTPPEQPHSQQGGKQQFAGMWLKAGASALAANRLLIDSGTSAHHATEDYDNVEGESAAEVSAAVAKSKHIFVSDAAVVKFEGDDEMC